MLASLGFSPSRPLWASVPSPNLKSQLRPWVQQYSTELLHAAVSEDLRLCRVQTTTSKKVADFKSVDEAVATVPEVEQVEHISNVCAHITPTSASSVH